MSLEKAIAENTAAIHALIAALSNPSVAQSGGNNAQAPVADNSACSTAEDSSVAKPEAAAKKPAKSKAESEQPTAAAEGVTKDKVVEALKALAVSQGRDAVVAVLAQFKAAKLDDVNADDYAAVIAACGAA